MSKFRIILVLGASTLLLATATAQRRPNDSHGPRPPMQMQAPRQAPNVTNPRGAGPHAGDWLRNTMQLPPQEQEKKLEQDPQFRQLPPERQQRLRDRLNHFNSLSPDQKQRVLNHMEVMDHLSPVQQKQAQDLFSQFRTLDPNRKHQMIKTLRQLRSMPPDARQRLLDSPQLKSNHTPEELNLLRGLNDLGFVNNNRLDGQQ